MKLVYIVPTLKDIGPTRQLRALVSSLKQENYSITIITFRKENDNELIDVFQKIGIDIYQLSRTKTSLLKNILKTRKLLTKISPEVVHSHLFYRFSFIFFNGEI